MISPEILGIPEQLDRFNPDQKSIDMLIAFQNFVAMLDSALVCQFVSFAMGAQEFANLLNPLTGWNYTVEDLDELGARIWNLEKMFNIREGIVKNEDTLPTRILEDPIPAGPSQGHTVPLNTILPMYYKTRGWDQEGNVPDSLKTKLGL